MGHAGYQWNAALNGSYTTLLAMPSIVGGSVACTLVESKAGKVLLLHDLHPDTIHAHPGFWNVTPESHMLEVLPQDYTLFSAIADELDNSLQAVYQLQTGKQPLIRVNLEHKDGIISIYDTGKGMDGTPDNCITKWGTLGSLTNRHVVPEAIGGDPPYLKEDSYHGTHGEGFLRDDRNAPFSNFLVRPTSSRKV